MSGGAVDFARIYRRARDAGDASEALGQLADELALAAQQRRADRNSAAAALLAPPPETAADERHLLRESAGAGGAFSASASGRPARRVKGRPLARFPPAASPFAEALGGAGERAKRRRVREALDGADDARHQRVQQVPWERRILWGVTGDARSGAQVVEVDDGDERIARPAERSSSSSAPSSTSSSSRRRVAVGALEAPQAPAAADGAFDMTKPRNYRWEIDGESARTVRARTAPAAAAAPATALPCPLNRELLDDSWVHAIGWRETRDMPASRLVLDANDAQLAFLAPHAAGARPTLHIPKRKIGEAEQRLLLRKQQELEKNSRVDGAMTTIGGSGDTGAATIGSAVGGKKKPRPRVVESIGVAHHSLLAVKLSLTKPELPLARLRALHRPRGRFKINERLQFAAPPGPPPSAALAHKQSETALVTQVKKSADLSPAAGGRLILVEYSEQTPPVLASPGMAAQLLHYWRPPPDDDKGRAKKDRPKPPDMARGKVITLGDRDESPFVGDVPAGRVVTSLNSKLFKVPLFPHAAAAPFASSSEPSELFLLVRSAAKSKKGALDARSTVHVLELPAVFTAGQVEPQMEVPAPNSRSATEFIRPYMSFHILRLFKKKAGDGEHLKMEDVAHAFPNQSSTAIRKRMQEVATFERGGNDSGWWKKKDRTALGGSGGSELDDLRARISPESVCLYESMMAGQRRLLDVGLTKWFTPTGVDGAISHLLKRLELRKQRLSAKLVAPRGLERRAEKRAETELWKADPVVRKLEKDIQVARYIEEQLQLSPWNLTNGYVECHLQGKGSGMLMLAGVGDPTGRGEGFSFIRIPQWRAKRKEGDDAAAAGGSAGGSGGTGTGGGSASAKAVAEVTGTEADLRKLKMREMGDVLRNLGLADAEIDKLPRWDRVHMIREMSNRATAIGFRQLSRFARDGRKSLSAQQQAYRQRCDVVYARQMDVLSAARTTFSSDEASEDDDDDLDAWEEDIEADITGGGGEMDTIVSKRGPKNLFANGGGGRLDRSAESLREREEAVELRRLMEEMKEESGGGGSTATATAAGSRQRSEVDASALRSQLRASGIQDRPSASASAAASARPGSSLAASRASSVAATPLHVSRSSSPTRRRPEAAKRSGRKVVKRTTRLIAEDGTESVRIEFIVDEPTVARFRALQQRKARQLESEAERGAGKRKRAAPSLDASSSSHSGGGASKAKKRKQLEDELKQLQVTEEQNKAYQEMLQSRDAAAALDSTPTKRGGVRCTQCGQPGHIRTNRSCPLYLADDGRPPAAATSTSSSSKSATGR